MPEAIGRARNALRAFAQIRFVQKIGNQTAVKSFAGLPMMLVNTLSSGVVALEIVRMRSKADILENAEDGLTPMMRNLIDMLRGEWNTVEQQIEELTDKLEQISASDAGCCRIRKIPGIGPIVATAIVAAIGNGAAFRKGRDFAAWLGLVPRQYSTGARPSCWPSASVGTSTYARS